MSFLPALLRRAHSLEHKLDDVSWNKEKQCHESSAVYEMPVNFLSDRLVS